MHATSFALTRYFRFYELYKKGDNIQLQYCTVSELFLNRNGIMPLFRWESTGRRRNVGFESKACQIGYDQFETFQRIDDEASFAGQATLLGTTLAFVKALVSALGCQIQAFFGRFANKLRHVPCLLL